MLNSFLIKSSMVLITLLITFHKVKIRQFFAEDERWGAGVKYHFQEIY